MQLLIDAGNTRAKWMLVDASGDQTKGSLNIEALSENVVVSELSKNQTNISDIFIACVASKDVEGRLEKWCDQQFLAKVCLIKVENNFASLRLCYSDVSALGVDRWLCLLAVARQHSKDADDLSMIVDAGTAITVDFLAGQTRHLGGFISPGCKMMFDSLGEATSRVGLGGRPVELEASKLGDDTQSCVEQGVRAAIEGVVLKGLTNPDQLSLPHAPTDVFVAGGDLATVLPIIKGALNSIDSASSLPIRLLPRPELVFEGMIAYAAIMKTRNV